MPAGLDLVDRRLLIGAALVLGTLILAVKVVSPPESSSTGIPSTYSAGWDGAKACFLMLKDLGYRVDRWEQSPEEISYPPSETIMILAEPVVIASSEERAALHRFVRAGGTLLATGMLAPELVPEVNAEFTADPLERQSKEYGALLPSPLARGARTIVMAAESRWKSEKVTPLGVYGDDHQAVVVTYGVDKGRVIWWAGAAPLTNGGIREKDNLALLLNVLGKPGERHILWDEYFHGTHGSLWSYFARTPLPWFGVQLGVLLVAAFFTFSRRSGPARAPATTSRLSPMEFVETLGDLYRSAHAAPSAVAIAYERLRFLLARQLGLPAKCALPEIAHRASERLGWNESRLLDTLARAERARRSIDLHDPRALNLVQELHDYAARLERRTSRQQGRDQ